MKWEVVMRNRSYFWPAILILTGLIALVAETGAISGGRLARLADLWPVILIAIGLELMNRRVLQGPRRDLATALIVLVAAGGAIAYVAVRGPVSDTTQTVNASDAVGSLNQATLDVNAGAATITVEGSNSLGSDLYRAHIEYSGTKPAISLDRSTGSLRIFKNNDFAFFTSRRFVLDLQLNSGVSWNLNADTGASNDTFKLSTVKVGSITLNAGASRTDITLGRPTGTVPISVDGGAITLRLHRPSGSEAFVHVSGGAVNLSADGRQLHGVGEESWQSAGYDGAVDAYHIEINGGASNVTLDTSAA
jgi:cell wall-active antibiotic response 4TMS protein YvqF